MRTIDLCLTLNLVIMAECFFMEKFAAEIGYAGVYKAEDQYRIKFNSNIDLDLLYSEQNGGKVVSRRLVCSLVDDVNFAVDHELEKFFRGNFNVVLMRSNVEESPFEYEAIGNFYLSQDRGASKRVICSVSCDHVPRRSWPLFRAKAMLGELIVGFSSPSI
ncbi:hypothetical protein [Massilia arenae]|uniref:Uncharacterized protein n=1 Tax=Massilia arenae TaxID=2603288 RepID=A0A5C7FQL9_9BURK|nr:hypothetical protein [Massilia arenae]TXF96645.1 hypothetical protein FVD38_23755 [Massilia arenae]